VPGARLLVPAPAHFDRFELAGGVIQARQPLAGLPHVVGDVAVKLGRRRDAGVREPFPGAPERFPEDHARPCRHGFHVEIEAEAFRKREVAAVGPGLERHNDLLRLDRLQVLLGFREC
jgi:hypothetical protein